MRTLWNRNGSRGNDGGWDNEIGSGGGGEVRKINMTNAPEETQSAHTTSSKNVEITDGPNETALTEATGYLSVDHLTEADRLDIYRIRGEQVMLEREREDILQRETALFDSLVRESDPSINTTESAKYREQLQAHIIEFWNNTRKDQPAVVQILEDNAVMIYVNEAPEGEPEDYVALMSPDIEFMNYLISQGVDIIQISQEELGHRILEFRTQNEVIKLDRAAIEQESSNKQMEIEEVVVGSVRKEQNRIVQEALRSGNLHDLEEALSHLTELNKSAINNDELKPLGYKLEAALAEGFDILAQERHSQLSPELNQRLLQYFEDHEDEILSACASYKYDYANDLETSNAEHFMKETFRLSSQEVIEKRARNWQQVHEYIQQHFAENNELITLESLEDIHQLSSKGLIPQRSLGIRTGEEDVVVGGLKDELMFSAFGVHHSLVKRELQFLVTQANRLAVESQNTNHNRLAERHKFYDQLADHYANYVIIHPHNDGNGTMAVFLMEAVKARAGYPTMDKYDIDPIISGKLVDGYQHRVMKSLGYDILAINKARKAVNRFLQLGLISYHRYYHVFPEGRIRQTPEGPVKDLFYPEKVTVPL